MAWLPSKMRARPRRPCDDMTIKSHCLLFAASIIASAAVSVAVTVSHSTPHSRAAMLTLPSMRAASCSAALWYSMKAAAVSLLAIESHGSIAVRAVTFAPASLASARPAATALPASSEPSVAIRMCVYMAYPPQACRFATLHRVRRSRSTGPVTGKGKGDEAPAGKEHLDADEKAERPGRRVRQLQSDEE